MKRIESILTIVLFFNITACKSSYVELQNQRKEEFKSKTQDKILTKDQLMLDSLYQATNGKGFWEVTNSSQLKEYDERRERIESIFKTFGIDIQKTNKFSILEEENIEVSIHTDPNIYGILFLSNKTLQYKYENKEGSPIIKTNNLLNSEITINEKSRAEIVKYIQSCNYDELATMAKNEVLKNTIGNDKYQYYILFLNSCKQKGINEIYLHENNED